MRRLALGVLLAGGLSLLLAACNDNTTTAPSTVTHDTLTENFSGDIAQGGSRIHTFKANYRGVVTATLLTLSPLATGSVGFTIGLWDGTNCTVVADSNNVKIGAQVIGTTTIDDVSLCLKVYDAGNIMPDSTWSYTASVVHY